VFLEIFGIYDREKSFKVFAFDVTQRYESVQRFVIADAELRKLGGEVDRVPREEVPMNAVERAIDQERDISILEEIRFVS